MKLLDLDLLILYDPVQAVGEMAVAFTRVSLLNSGNNKPEANVSSTSISFSTFSGSF